MGKCEEGEKKAAENSQLIFTFTLRSRIDLAGRELDVSQRKQGTDSKRISTKRDLELKYLNRQNVEGVNGVRESVDDFILFWSEGSYKRRRTKTVMNTSLAYSKALSTRPRPCSEALKRSFVFKVYIYKGLYLYLAVHAESSDPFITPAE